MGNVEAIESIVAEKAGPVAKVVSNKVLKELSATRTSLTDELLPVFVDLLVKRAVQDEPSRRQIRQRIERQFGIPANYSYDDATVSNIVKLGEMKGQALAKIASLDAIVKECESLGFNMSSQRQELQYALYYINSGNFNEANRYLYSAENFLSVVKTGLQKGAQQTAPQVTQTPQGKDRILKTGGYIIKGVESDRAFAVLKMHLDDGFHGICLSRTHPDRLAKAHGLANYPNLKILWLSQTGLGIDDPQEQVTGLGLVGIGMARGGEETVDEDETFVVPTNLSHISLVINSFLMKHHAEGNAEAKTIVLLDGFDYLVTQNDYQSVLKLVQKINEYVVLHSSRFIMPLDPSTLDERELRLIEREMPPID